MIKGLQPRLAEAGKIKIGAKGELKKSGRGNEFRPPVKLDHFLITKTERDANGDFIVDTEMLAAIGTDADDGHVRSIPIVLHSDRIDEVFPTSYALYTGRRCVCRGDGEKAIKREIKDKVFTGKEKEVDCPCSYLNAADGPKCKPNGKLYCSIAAPGAAVAGAVHIWRTTSIISIQQMVGSLEQIRSICGVLRNVPLWLRVKPVTIERADGTITVYCCHVELRAADVADVQRRALEAARVRRELGFRDEDYRRIVSLPAHGESAREEEEIAEELYPEDESNQGGEAAAVEDAPATAAGTAAGRKSGDLF